MDTPQPPRRLDMTVISTVLDEVDNVEALVESLMNGTVRPAEIVIADGGSTDGTLEALEALSASHPLRTIGEAGGRSSGRNRAIESASHDLIASIDGGCTAQRDWLERLSAPMLDGAEWAGGFYEPAGTTPKSNAIGLTMVYVREEAEGHFVPSARSMAFTRRAWQLAGGFPEDLQFGEDSAFADNLMLAGVDPAFVSDAVVNWVPPSSLGEQWRTMWNWGRGDGLAGLRSQHYKRILGVSASVAGAAIILGVIDLRLAPVAVLAAGPLVVEHTRLKYRHMNGFSKFLWIPVASVNGLLASLAGFLSGRRARKRMERE